MRLTLDTSVLVAAVAEEKSKPRIVQATLGAELIAPHSVHWEFGNAISSLVRRNRLTTDLISNIGRIYERIPIQYSDISLEHAMDIATAERIYAYDAYIIACAQKYRTPLLTLDNQLKRVALKQGVEILEV